MNFWKIAFFTLLGGIAAVLVGLIWFLGNVEDSEPLPKVQTYNSAGNKLTVKATKADLEGIANGFISKAVKQDTMPVTMQVGEDVVLHSEATVFSFKLPVTMHFDPVVREDGNLILKQSSMEIGNLNIQPATILKFLKDSVKLPDWIIVRPKEEEIFINLSEIPISGKIQMKAKTFNLAEDNIELEVIIPD
ncbi:hypothetical protein NCCP2222_34280 [Sporosarcina sp. NCCP-2222]|uniref:YpmS family protein n=1 Tax=Sporosarcina sp. NCCP-2222 TaxID=2935073 RepID=UPI0020843E2B|nr:YpmS family protein [Sporosarcina sp. NCCP-2222]GKV57481.1 hypothetical protein NCCP2222_34280 [Sporosarcina sp. NCCP-2222]